MLVLTVSYQLLAHPTPQNRPDLAEMTNLGGKRDLEAFRNNGFDF